MRFQWFDRGFTGMVLSMLVAASAVGCHKDAPSTTSGEEVRIPDQEARDFTLTESMEGRKSWTLWATYAAMYNDKNLVDARTVRIDFFDKEGKKNSSLTADQGIVFQRTNDLEARGKVHVTTESGVTLETDSLRWQNARGKIVSDAFVRVTRNGDVVTGYGFESDATLEHFHLAREVRAEVQPQSGENPDSVGSPP